MIVRVVCGRPHATVNQPTQRVEWSRACAAAEIRLVRFARADEAEKG
jgi:hypothetical protein